MAILFKTAPRCSGKTTTVKSIMFDDFGAILLVPSVTTRLLYPKEEHDRIYTFDEFVSSRIFGCIKNDNKTLILIDEGFLGNEVLLAKLYYFLGKYLNNCEIRVYGTTKEMEAEQFKQFGGYKDK